MSRPLDNVDLTASLSASESLEQITAAQRRLTHLRLFAAGLLGAPAPGPGIVVIFEGLDAAGKGGAIRRVTAALDPRHVRVVPTGPPSELEAAHHFLWRFSGPLPARGGLTIFDRSWYGRVLVERVEASVSPNDVERAYREIVEFERALADDGTILVKFWLHVSPNEQLRRFLARQEDPLKRWKLTADDWHNRERRGQYEEAANVMLERTDHTAAPWHVVAGEDKRFARVDVLRSLNRAIEQGLTRHGLEIPPSHGDQYLG